MQCINGTDGYTQTNLLSVNTTGFSFCRSGYARYSLAHDIFEHNSTCFKTYGVYVSYIVTDNIEFRLKTAHTGNARIHGS
ncbi:hypothetical protein D3C81_1535910 [compost metagenome]